MFEKRLREISKKLGEGQVNEFYVLTHKKHRREIYFRNTPDAMRILREKLSSPLKRVVYMSIKTNFAQPFLKKIKLSSKFGETILVANQIKSFDVKRKRVTSYTKSMDKEEIDFFIKSKESQKKIAAEGFAPKVFQISREFPLCQEELLSQYTGGKDNQVFRKLLSYYHFKEIKEVSLKNYLRLLSKESAKIKNDDVEIKKILDKISSRYPGDMRLKIVNSHGSFTKEQVLVKKGNFIFTDWDRQDDLIISDLVKFMRDEENIFKNSKFKGLLKLYPEEIRKNIGLYVILNEISSASKSRTKKLYDFSNKRIIYSLRKIK